MEAAKPAARSSVSRWRLQANTSQSESFLSLIEKFYLNRSAPWTGTRDSGDRVTVWSLLYIL